MSFGPLLPSTTVEPLNNGHIGTWHFVIYRKVVLPLEIKFTSIIGKWDLKLCPL